MGSYCHGNFHDGNTTNAPTWTGTNQATCGTCHGTATNAAPGGTHPSVAANSCDQCHPGYTGTTVNLASQITGKDQDERRDPDAHGPGPHWATSRNVWPPTR